MADETFDGSVWPMAVPSAVLALEAEIRAWQEKNGDAAASPFTSESFGGYSYLKGSSGSASANGAVTWQTTFKSRMNQWRKI